jgi:hypothetical protein
MYKRIFLILAAAGALEAQQVVAPTPDQVGSPRGDTVNNYNVTQSFETGYRWSIVNGDVGMYRQVVNFGNGIRLLGSSLAVNSKDGHGHYFDQILLNTQGLGNDPYQSVFLRIQKNQLYQYDMHWRLSYYYNPGLTVAGGLHLQNTGRRIQDHDLTLLPLSQVHFRLGFTRNKEDGPALSTAQEFDLNGSGLPVFSNVRRLWTEYRLGADVNLAGFQFTLTRRWDYFKDDTPFSLAGVVAAGTPNDQTVLQSFVRGEPIHGSNPGWLGNLFTRRKYWGINARMTYVGGERDFILDEFASGIGQFGGPANRIIVVGGNATRPAVAGDFSINVFPTEKLTVINNSSVSNSHMSGDSSYSEFNTGLNFGTTINFRYLAILLVTNSTDVNYRWKPWLGFYGGYYYSDRQVSTIEGIANSTQNPFYEVSNHLNTGVAGIRLKPWKELTINLDGTVQRANNPLTPISERNYHTINGRVSYRTRQVQLLATYSQVYNLNAPVLSTTFDSHSRQYGVNGSWTPNGWFSIDASYVKLHLNTTGSLAFFAAAVGPSQLQTAFPSLYISNIHAGNLGARFSIRKRADLFVGYAITKDTGDGRPTQVPAGVTNPVQSLLDSVQTFPLTYQSPMARVSVRISPKLRWNVGYQFYGYGEMFHILGYDQTFHANNGYTSLLWAF